MAEKKDYPNQPDEKFYKSKRIPMTSSPQKFEIYLETGKQKVFAGALEWPGWCRSGRDETGAIEALAAYGARYARAIESAQVEFLPPLKASAFRIVERLKGNATTDFGSPGLPPKYDSRPMSEKTLHWSEAVLTACWRTFDNAVRAAGVNALRKGPRGGGRELDEIVRHLIDADAAYLSKIGVPFPSDKTGGPAAELRRMRGAILEGLAAAAGGKLPAYGPRGGSRWSPRYFVRRVAWHALDHAWEIEDRKN
jgi:hypothetical protein